ncbi:MAG: DNRLRE domain-containing protein, partial [Taibaiella sp.]
CNFGSTPELLYNDWTWNGSMGLGPKIGGCPNGTIRTLIRFDEIGDIPPCAIITEARLLLYGIPSASVCSWCWNSWPNSNPGLFSNEGWVKRIRSPWNELGVTWNNFGAPTNANVTSTGQLPIAPSGSAWGWNPDINVTSLVQDIINGAPNFGWQLSLQTEVNYRGMIFGSRENPNNALHPRLQITYVENGGFEYCFNTNNTNLYTFSTLNPLSGYTYTWLINGTPYTGSSITVDLTTIISPPNWGNSYTVTMTATNNSTGAQCVKSQGICLSTGGNTIGNCAAFSVCRKNTDPNTFNLQALNPAGTGMQFSWAGLGGTGATVTYPNGINGDAAVVSFSAPPTPSPYQTNASLSVVPIGGGSGTCLSALKMCYVFNQARPARETSTTENDGSVPQYSYMVAPDAIPSAKQEIFPNPTSSDWTVNLVSTADDHQASIQVSDITGKLISSQTQVLHAGSNIIHVSGNNIAPGMYFMEVKQGSVSVKEKIIKIK